MIDVLQLLTSGVQNGIAYSLVGLALVLIFQTTHVLNFAQGTISSISGFVAYDIVVSAGLPWIWGGIASVAIGCVAGIVVERIAIRPLLGAPQLTLVLATVAVDSIIENAIQLVFGADIKSLPPPWAGDDFNVGGIILSRTYLVIAVVAAIVVVFLTILLKKTILGLRMRAFADDQFAAELQGISSRKVSFWAWMIAGGIGGITGVLFAPLLYVQLQYMNSVFIYGFTAAVVGGLVSQPGAIVGGLLLGVIEVLANRYSPPTIASLLPLLVILGVLIWSPGGLFTRGASRRYV